MGRHLHGGLGRYCHPDAHPASAGLEGGRGPHPLRRHHGGQLGHRFRDAARRREPFCGQRHNEGEDRAGFRAAVPFLIAMLVVLGFVTFVPEISLFLID